jgi:uncharacterized coiled-coil DUF342 family protein
MFALKEQIQNLEVIVQQQNLSLEVEQLLLKEIKRLKQGLVGQEHRAK